MTLVIGARKSGTRLGAGRRVGAPRRGSRLGRRLGPRLLADGMLLPVTSTAVGALGRPGRRRIAGGPTLQEATAMRVERAAGAARAARCPGKTSGPARAERAAATRTPGAVKAARERVGRAARKVCTDKSCGKTWQTRVMRGEAMKRKRRRPPPGRRLQRRRGEDVVAKACGVAPEQANSSFRRLVRELTLKCQNNLPQMVPTALKSLGLIKRMAATRC
mmetsp:Transcript_4341/g.8263  ORF Transcript_4341/g.8263 Transcript_4341/m.8263 type:complete len:219 (-) Transcript_4341:189-845(-)